MTEVQDKLNVQVILVTLFLSHNSLLSPTDCLEKSVILSVILRFYHYARSDCKIVFLSETTYN